MANYLKMPYAKNNQDPTPGSPTLRLSMGPTLLYFYLSDTLCQQPMDTETPTPTSQDATPCSARTSAADCPADPNAASHCLTEMSSSRAQDTVTINCSPEDIRLHPKATQQRKRTRRALGRSRVLTETPEKAELEAKVRKTKKTLTANKKLATQGKATKKRLFRNDKRQFVQASIKAQLRSLLRTPEGGSAPQWQLLLLCTVRSKPPHLGLLMTSIKS
ncbi:LOW QUALITY PROTEIN: hypothetical protein PoB_000566900 [Plakobranchus ocellatus]|uniref:Uncharacterized protein n=1 Tax=Plakobranchus ocellatus TaxID=259542 RepID=A0AAV3YAS1_9GAST|nr:LOW QUALITY PROTEIN: hypothetical protein PoB_000566900 [Plakobranchus ocellatus]